MAQHPSELSETQMEKLLLRAMCQAAAGDHVWAIAARTLGTYRWRDPLHEALFAVLREIRSRNPLDLREHLPAALTRRGFPDVDWDEFFQPVALSAEEAKILVERLINTQGHVRQPTDPFP